MNLLEFISRCLVQVGERPLQTLQVYNGALAVQAARNALFEVSTLANWPWLTDVSGPLEWTSGKMLLPTDTLRVLSVFDTKGNRARHVSRQELDTVYISLNYGYSGEGGYPLIYCPEGVVDDKVGVLVRPYPLDTAGQVLMRVERTRLPTMTEADDDPVPVPNQLLTLYEMKTLHNLSSLLEMENKTIEHFASEYERLATRLRGQFTSKPATSMNMYRGGRL